MGWCFHNDIQITNIMFKHEHDKLYLIDFGRMSKATRFNAHDVDICDVNEVIKEVVKMGLYNYELKEIITELKKSMKEINIVLQELLKILTSLGKDKRRKTKKEKQKKETKRMK